MKRVIDRRNARRPAHFEEEQLIREVEPLEPSNYMTMKHCVPFTVLYHHRWLLYYYMPCSGCIVGYDRSVGLSVCRPSATTRMKLKRNGCHEDLLQQL